jgi:hypothetical protein
LLSACLGSLHEQSRRVGMVRIMDNKRMLHP